MQSRDQTRQEGTCLAQPRGFEPPPTPFVAERSIQLSYGCITGSYFKDGCVYQFRHIVSAGYNTRTRTWTPIRWLFV